MAHRVAVLHSTTAEQLIIQVIIPKLNSELLFYISSYLPQIKERLEEAYKIDQKDEPPLRGSEFILILLICSAYKLGT